MSQLLVSSEPKWRISFLKERRMTGARTSTLATLRGSIERIETHDATASDRVALGHAGADTALRGGLALGAVHEVFAEGRQSAAATGFIAGLARRVAARRPLLWVRQDFAEIESGALSMSGWSELGLDPRLVVTVRARRRGDRAANHRRRAGLRCARRRGDGNLGRDAAARSCRQPQADIGGANVGGHRPAAASRGGADALHGGDAMDRARGAFAAATRSMGRAHARHPTGS